MLNIGIRTIRDIFGRSTFCAWKGARVMARVDRDCRFESTVTFVMGDTKF